MKINTAQLQQRTDQFKERLKRSGIKLTHQRLVIFNVVAMSYDHPDVETVYRRVREKVPTVSLDTVYRTLWLLLDLGLVDTLGQPREKFRFDANMRPHHHFVCSRCGRTSDFYSKEFDQLKTPDSVKKLGRVEKTQVEITGICNQCSKK